MKNRLLFIVALVAAAGVFAVLPAHAQEEAPQLTDDHITRIQTNCQSALATLNQIHANDTPVYINRNQAYFSISDKLLAHLNSRLALNSYDTSVLVKITNSYNNEITKFRSVYKQYDDAMAELVKRNCSRQPVGFYTTVADVRKLRGAVHDSIAKLHALIVQYSQAVDAFEAQNETKLRVEKND